jgi:predicted aspartyl protease
MWLVAVFLLWGLLYSGTAAAFECAGVTLPSTLVICSDPELMWLADESSRSGISASPPKFEDDPDRSSDPEHLLQFRADEAEKALAAEKEISRNAVARVGQLNAQIAALRDQLAKVATALDVSEAKVKEQQSQIVELGKRLNLALVQKEELRTSIGDEVPLRPEGELYLVPVRINNADTLDFVVDSGASDVLLPADVVLTLFRTHTLIERDFTGSETYQMADGTELKSDRFVLRELSLGNYMLTNVEAYVRESGASKCSVQNRNIEVRSFPSMMDGGKRCLGPRAGFQSR